MAKLTEKQKAARRRAGLKRMRDHLDMITDPFFKLCLKEGYVIAHRNAEQRYRQRKEQSHAVR